MNIKLVKLAQADLPVLTKLLNQGDIAKWLWREDRYKRDWEIGELLTEAAPGKETQAFGIYWGGGDGAIVGSICLQDICGFSRTATIGNVAAHHAYQAIAGGREIVKYAFKTLNLNRLDCRYIEGCRLTPLMLKKIGGTEEGVLREVIYQNGKFKNVHIWSLLRSEWDGTATA